MNKKKASDKWITNHGACSFDFKTRNVLLHDGGLFSIEKKKTKMHKIVGHKNLPDGKVLILFSKKRIVPSEDYTAYLWFEEIDGTIAYFKSMKQMLNKLGIKTNYEYKKNLKEKIKPGSKPG